MRFLVYIILLCSAINLSAQKIDSTSFYKKRQQRTVIAAIGGTAIIHVGLYQLWYRGYPQSKFHFINDNNEWLQMDKCGHTFSAYYLSVAATEAGRWAGFKEKKAILYGGIFGSLFQDLIEVSDGFSSNWGASLGDLTANTTGSALCVTQNLLWGEQRVWLKYSFTQSPYAELRPNTLGSGLSQQFLKDYNGQTYWLSANIKSLSGNRIKIPSWINLAAGYGANGLLTGNPGNIWRDKNNIEHDFSIVKRYRQFYLSPDIDLTRIKTKHKGLKFFFKIANCVKFPLPAVEYNKVQGVKWHWLKF